MIKFSKCQPGAMCEGCMEPVPAVRHVTVAGGKDYVNTVAVFDLCGGCLVGLGQASALVCEQLQEEARQAGLVESIPHKYAGDLQ